MPDKRGGRSFVSAAGSGGGGGSSGGTPLQPPSNGSWAQAAWFIDPSNSSGVASDGNSGLDSGHPVLTWKGGVIARYGTLSPVLRQNTTWTFMSAHTDDTDPVIFKPYFGHGARGRITAAPVVVTSGVSLASVTSKVRATPQLLQANIGATGAVKQMVANTTVGKVSLAWVWKLVSGTTFSLSQPSTRTVVPFAGHVTEVDTWANTDTVNLLNPVNVNLVELRPVILDPDGAFDNALYVDGIQAFDPVGLASSPLYIGTGVFLQECSFQRNVFVDTWPLSDILSTQMQNCAFWAGLQSNAAIDGNGEAAVASSLMFGGIIQWNTFNVQTLNGFDLDGDIILGNPVSGNMLFVNCVFGTVYIDTGTIGMQGSCGTEAGASGILWGPGGFDVQGKGRLVLGNTATLTLLNKGVIRINAQALASAYDTLVDPGAWHPGRTLNPANLDASIMTGGFGSVAINPAGGSIIVGTIS